MNEYMKRRLIEIDGDLKNEINNVNYPVSLNIQYRVQNNQ